MEGDTHRHKGPGAARAGVVAGCLLLALLLALPGAWYAAYHDQLAPSAARSVRFGAAPLSRPSGVISLGPPGPGQTRMVQIQHTGGQVVTTVNEGSLTITARTTDPRPPSNSLDALGQSLCDRYNAWKCENGDPRQPPNVFVGMGNMRVQMHYPPTVSPVTLPTGHLPAPPPPSAHAPGTRAPR